MNKYNKMIAKRSSQELMTLKQIKQLYDWWQKKLAIENLKKIPVTDLYMLIKNNQISYKLFKAYFDI